jgi:hypothetical protein
LAGERLRHYQGLIDILSHSGPGNRQNKDTLIKRAIPITEL